MLKLSTKGRYAVRIAVYLAGQQGQGPSRKQDIAESESISPDYAEQILIRLRAGGLVTSHRGARGGFTLARDPKSMSVMDVLEATEGPLEIAPCTGGPCDHEAHCVVQDVWSEAAAALKDIFSRAVISSLAEQAAERQAKRKISYEI